MQTPPSASTARAALACQVPSSFFSPLRPCWSQKCIDGMMLRIWVSGHCRYRPLPGSLQFPLGLETGARSQNGVPENLSNARTVDFVPDSDPRRSTSLLGFSVAVGRPGRQGGYVPLLHAGTVLGVPFDRTDASRGPCLLWNLASRNGPHYSIHPHEIPLLHEGGYVLRRIYLVASGRVEDRDHARGPEHVKRASP